MNIEDISKAMWAFKNNGVTKILLHPDNFDKLCLCAHILHPSSRLSIYGIYIEKNRLAPADGWIEVFCNSEIKICRPKKQKERSTGK